MEHLQLMVSNLWSLVVMWTEAGMISSQFVFFLFCSSLKCENNSMCSVRHDISQLFTHHLRYMKLHGINRIHRICIGTVVIDGPHPSFYLALLKCALTLLMMSWLVWGRVRTYFRCSRFNLSYSTNRKLWRLHPLQFQRAECFSSLELSLWLYFLEFYNANV